MDPPALVVARRPLRVRVGVGGAIVLVLVALGIAVLVSALGGRGSSQSVTPPRSSAPALPGPASTGGPRASSNGATIYVHILGAVAKPGLYLLTDGDRAVDLVAAAGGFTATADQSGLNLARPLVDGEQVLVPNIGELPVAVGGTGAATAGGKINLNTADATALETLPRVGPAMAQRIIDWRTKNGRFTALEDLMSVTGVGQKTFDSLKDLVTL
ncbi:MAG: ComEA family DNA-binding protein [Actinomycetota bacterium]